MANFQRRLERLEAARVQHDTPAWLEANAALTRQTAHVRLVVGERLGTAADHYAMVDARETLGEDTPEQEAADLELINRWRRVHKTPERPAMCGNNCWRRSTPSRGASAPEYHSCRVCDGKRGATMKRPYQLVHPLVTGRLFVLLRGVS